MVQYPPRETPRELIARHIALIKKYGGFTDPLPVNWRFPDSMSDDAGFWDHVDRIAENAANALEVAYVGPYVDGLRLAERVEEARQEAVAVLETEANRLGLEEDALLLEADELNCKVREKPLYTN